MFGIVSKYGPLTTAVGIAGAVVFMTGVTFGTLFMPHYPVLDDYKPHIIITAVVGCALMFAGKYMMVTNGDR